MTSVHALGVSGAGGTAGGSTVHVVGVTGVGAAPSGTTIHVLNVRGSGTGQPTLTAPKAAYEPGETVTVAASNRGDTDTFTVSYNGLAFITITVGPAFALVNGKPALITVSTDKASTDTPTPTGYGASYGASYGS